MNSLKRKTARFFASWGLLILLAAICTVTAFAITVPLWKWASSSPSSYTVFTLSAAAAFILYRIFLSARKAGLFAFTRRLVKIAVPLAGLGAALYFLSRNSVIAAAASVAAAVLIYTGAVIVFGKISRR